VTSPLSIPVTAIRGIGEETAASLAQVGIHTVDDLLQYFPYRFEDRRLRDLAEAAHDEMVTVVGVVAGLPVLTYFGGKKSRLAVRIRSHHTLFTAVLFNQPYLKNKLQPDLPVKITGKWNRYRKQMIVKEIKWKWSDEGDNRFEPVYAVRGDLTVKGLRRFISLAMQQFGDWIEETLPDAIRKRYRLCSKQEAIRAMHFPRSPEEIKQARRRLVYEEFLIFQLKMQGLRKFQREQGEGMAVLYDEEKVTDFIAALPFRLTGAQHRVLKEILGDIRLPYRMNRLLQGDVGSGKTVVAAIVLYAVASSGYQGALMAPTEILAEQHARTISRLLAPFGVKVELLTGAVKGKKRRDILNGLEEGTIPVVIGTHALIQDEVYFKKLAIVITDEQHRFGVEQRRSLREKGENPHTLFMTATPIPRTLAITAFGEMDVSTIDEMPAGRKPVKTEWLHQKDWDRVLGMIEEELSKGRQAYVICPLIEESDKLDVQNAIDVHAALVHHFRDRFSIGLLHGRMAPEEKDEVMTAFSENRIHLLVATTVVEVGVNVPNATLMIVNDAERFGLAQLHQLRGRVGRGDHPSRCILIADPKTEIGKERMRIMTETNDGFLLSEKDLELRGPGDFFGKKQSGLPEFKLGDMVHDYRALLTARRDAEILINSRVFWQHEAYVPLRRMVEESGVLSGEKLD